MRTRLDPILTVAGVVFFGVGVFLLVVPQGDRSHPAEIEAPASAPWFVNVTDRCRVDFVHESGHEDKFYLPESMAGGVGLLDYDGDGWLDVYFVQSGRITDAAADRPGNRLYRNRGDGTFENVTDEAGVGDRGYGMGCATGDYNNDGRIDLYVTNVGPNVLYRNNGDGTFSDVSKDAGVDHRGFGASAAFADYDRDGDLDLFVTNYIRWSPEQERACVGFDGVSDYCIPTAYRSPEPDVLYNNNGDGTFTDVSTTAGLRAHYGNGLGAVWAELSGDDLIDLCVANDLTANDLWVNQGNGTFVNEALQRGIAFSGDGLEEAGMGIDARDADGDGDFDVLMTHFAADTNTFYRNRDFFFVDDSRAAGLGSSFPYTGFGTGIRDFDNDGYVDIFVANGRVVARRGAPPSQDPYADPNQLFAGTGDGHFREVDGHGAVADRPIRSSRGAAFGDINNDGAMDIVVANRNAPPDVLLNRTAPRGRWITLRIVNRSGADAIGARVAVSIGGRRLIDDVRTAYSYCAASDPRVHFGLGERRRVDDVRVTWPDGAAQSFGSFEAGQFVTLRADGGQ